MTRRPKQTRDQKAYVKREESPRCGDELDDYGLYILICPGKRQPRGPAVRPVTAKTWVTDPTVGRRLDCFYGSTRDLPAWTVPP